MKIQTFCGGYDNNFCYIIHNETEGIIIDPSVPTEFLFKYAEEHNIKIKAAFIMHSHGDHIVELENYRKKSIPLYAHSSAKMRQDKDLEDNEELNIVGMKLKVLHTPGHRFDCICILIGKHLFTSDTLFIHGCGRVDFEGSEPKLMIQTLNRLKELPNETIIYPGHDYGPTPTATLGEEKKHNHFLNMSPEEFLGNRLS